MRKKRKLQAQATDLTEQSAQVPPTSGQEHGAAMPQETEADPSAIANENSEPEALTDEQLKSACESLLFAANKPLKLNDFKRMLRERDTKRIGAALQSLGQDYQDRGIVLHDVAGGFQFRTQPRNAEFVQKLVVGRPVRLTRAQLECLAIIAYRQPITRPDIDVIRGVDTAGTLKILLDRELIRVLGKREEPGRPLLYGTTKEFLEFFNLRDLRELPTLREYQVLSEDSMRVMESKLGSEETASESDANDNEQTPTSDIDEQTPTSDIDEQTPTSDIDEDNESPLPSTAAKSG